jgi:hypothetical protein
VTDSSRPLPPGPVETDADGDPLPMPAENTDLADAIQLLEFCRRKGYVVGPMLRVGKLVMQIVDIRQRKREGLTGDPAPDKSDIWEEHGYKPRDGLDDGG